MLRTTIVAAMLLANFATSGLLAQDKAQAKSNSSRTYKRDIPAALLSQAKISEDSALSVAQHKVPLGAVRSVELEREHGKLIYSLEFKTQGKSGVDEVNVDALTGAVIAVEHESPASEAKEQAAEKAEKARKKPNQS